MLANHTHERLAALGLPGMAKALDDQQRQPDTAALTFEVRLGLMIDREVPEPDNKRLIARLKFAQLRQAAVLDAIENMGYDTLHRRPSIGKAKQARLLGRALVSRAIARKPKPPSTENAAAFSANSVAASYEECQRIIKAAHSNFYYAFYLLPKPKRNGLTALYAFMRLVDDVADEGDNVSDKQRGLAKWRAAFDVAVTQSPELQDTPPPAGASVLPDQANHLGVTIHADILKQKPP